MKHRGKTNTYLVEFLEGDNKEKKTMKLNVEKKLKIIN